MRWLWFLLAMAVLTACSSWVVQFSNEGELPVQADPDMPVAIPIESSVRLDNLGQAPELKNEVWLNVDHPLRLADLTGKVVLLEMWTYGCINCRNVIPSLREWHQKYSEQGLVVIGNHYPEFSSERDLNNLKDAILKLEIPYAVAQDNDGMTWRAYRNHYWPTLYLIDKAGRIRYVHIGEGRYEETEQAFRALLAE